MKKTGKTLISLVLVFVLAASLAACGKKSEGSGITIAVPNDTTNEARALLLCKS